MKHLAVFLAAMLALASCSRGEETAPDQAEADEAPSETTVAAALKDFDEGRMESALEKINAALKEQPEDTGAMRIKSMILASLEKYAEAALVLEELTGREPDDLDIQHFLGTVYYKQKLWKRALKRFEKSLKAPSRSAEARERLIVCYEKTGQLGKSIELVKEMLAENPTDALLLARLGVLQLSAGSYRDAEKSFLKALETDPKLLEAYDCLAVTRAMLEDYDNSEKTLLEAIRRFPREPGFRIRLTETYLQLGRPLDALTVIEQLEGMTGESKQIKQLRSAAETMLKAQGKPVPPK